MGEGKYSCIYISVLMEYNNLFIIEIIGQLDEQYTSFTTNSLINVTIEHHYQFAFTKATGVMLGMRMEGSISGLANGTVVEIYYNYKTEQIGYDLLSYQLGGPTWPFPGFEYVLALSVVGTLAIPFIIRRRKILFLLSM